LDGILRQPSDHTLTPEEIRSKVHIEGFDAQGLKGIAYDFRIGDTILLAEPERVRPFKLGEGFPAVTLKPGLSAVIYSYETVHMPW